MSGRDLARTFAPRAVIYFRCESCTGVVRARTDQADQPVACPRCGHTQACPAREEAPAVPQSSRPSAARLLVGLLALGSLGAVAWTAVRVGSDGSVGTASSAANSIEALQRTILEANIGLPGDADLLRHYAALNAKHFHGRLPAMPVRWEPRLDDVGRVARQAFTLEGMFGHVGGRTAILIHPNLQRDPDGLARTLSHEMAHVQLWMTGLPGEQHGPEFQRELARLSLEGAFTGIVASPAEREGLRLWIDGERGRLDSLLSSERTEQQEIDEERTALETTIAAAIEREAPREELEALEGRRDAYNRRVAEASARAERRVSDAAELNRQIDRYNLMLSYPDGLDHQAPAAAQSAR